MGSMNGLRSNSAAIGFGFRFRTSRSTHAPRNQRYRCCCFPSRVPCIPAGHSSRLLSRRIHSGSTRHLNFGSLLPPRGDPHRRGMALGSQRSRSDRYPGAKPLRQKPHNGAGFKPMGSMIRIFKGVTTEGNDRNIYDLACLELGWIPGSSSHSLNS